MKMKKVIAAVAATCLMTAFMGMSVFAESSATTASANTTAAAATTKTTVAVASVGSKGVYVPVWDGKSFTLADGSKTSDMSVVLKAMGK